MSPWVCDLPPQRGQTCVTVCLRRYDAGERQILYQMMCGRDQEEEDGEEEKEEEEEEKG